MARRRQFRVIGGGAGIWSFIEIADAAAATVAAVGRGAPGVYNIVDSDPAPAAEWLAHLGQRGGGEPAAAPARLAGPAARRGLRRVPDDGGTRVVEREGREGTRLRAALRELAGGIPCLGQRMRRRPRTGRCCSPSPTG